MIAGTAVNDDERCQTHMQDERSGSCRAKKHDSRHNNCDGATSPLCRSYGGKNGVKHDSEANNIYPYPPTPYTSVPQQSPQHTMSKSKKRVS